MYMGFGWFIKMDLATNQGMHQTTVMIPVAMAHWVKEQGMTYNGAFRMGIKAMQERKSWNDELREIQGNMARYQARMIRAEQRLRELGQQVEA